MTLIIRIKGHAPVSKPLRILSVQFGHVGTGHSPPQSTPVSIPLWTPSEHVASIPCGTVAQKGI
jgi:hypothetical protein